MLRHDVRVSLGTDPVLAGRIAFFVTAAEAVVGTLLCLAVALGLFAPDAAFGDDVARLGLRAASVLLFGFCGSVLLGWARAPGRSCGCGIGDLPLGPVAFVRTGLLFVAALMALATVTDGVPRGDVDPVVARWAMAGVGAVAAAAVVVASSVVARLAQTRGAPA